MKIIAIEGPPRSGKSTLAQTMKAAGEPGSYYIVDGVADSEEANRVVEENLKKWATYEAPTLVLVTQKPLDESFKYEVWKTYKLKGEP